MVDVAVGWRGVVDGWSGRVGWMGGRGTLAAEL